MKNILSVINKYAKESPSEMVVHSEQWYEKEITEIAKRISEDDRIKIVGIAGPSGSGKTTTAHLMCDKLFEFGEKTVVVSLDDFYLPDDKLPILPDGSKDIESVNALDIPLLKKCFNDIITSGKTVVPKFDFHTKERIVNHKEIDITNRGIVVVEGLHALNPLISELVPSENFFKIYISVNLPIVDDFGEKLLSSRQIRFARRLLRDRIFRDTHPNKTMTLWKGVVEGEEKYLYCFKNTADVELKTLHFYEPCIYKMKFIALENEIDKNHFCYEFFEKTLNALKKFESIDENLVPHNSLIREFIGEGKYNTWK